jgi:hypothetical protein
MQHAKMGLLFVAIAAVSGTAACAKNQGQDTTPAGQSAPVPGQPPAIGGGPRPDCPPNPDQVRVLGGEPGGGGADADNGCPESQAGYPR